MKATLETYKKEKAIKEKLYKLGFYTSKNEFYKMYLLSFMHVFTQDNIKMLYSEVMFENGVEPLFEKSDNYDDFIHTEEMEAVNAMLARLSLGGYGNDVEML